MSLGSSAHALNLQTNVNQNRYFFATQEAGEQQLFLSTSVVAGLSTQSLGISGPAGNEVPYTTAPYFVGTEFIAAEQGLAVGGASTYWTPSTINSTITGISMSSDRTPGTGTGVIESYSGNGSSKGLEFLTRGVNSQVISSINTNMNNYISSIGNPGATALLRQNGSMLAGDSYVAPYFTSLNAQAGGGGRPAYGIQDLSGAAGITPLARWAIGTSQIAGGGNTGSDFTLFAYDDAGAYNNTPMIVRRSDGATAVQNISSIQNLVSTGTYAPVFPCSKTNVEFGIPTAGNTAPITGALSVLFSTPVVGLNPNTQTLLNINWANALSTTSGFVDFKVGFSTATAYTNIQQTAYLPGGGWTAGGAPSTIGNTNICCILDPDGLNPNGTGFLYVAGRTLNGLADTIYLDKGPVTEPTRNALCFRPL